MFTLKTSKNQFEDLIKKMAIHIVNDSFVFPIIAPLFTPSDSPAIDWANGSIEWIGKEPNFTAWVRADGIDDSYTKPTRMCFFAKHALNVLKDFKDNENIIIYADDKKEEYCIAGGKSGSAKLLMIPISNALGMQEALPFRLDASGVIEYNGEMRPDLFAMLDVAPIQQFIKNNKPKKDDNRPKIYHIIFDDRKKVIKVFVNEDTQKAIEIRTNVILGKGTVHYSLLFPETMNVLDGDIKLYALEGGHLWIAEDKPDLKVRYILPPAMMN